MSSIQQVSPARVDRDVISMIAAQRMASTEPSVADLEIAHRQASGEISAEDAVALAITAAREPYTAR